MEEVRKCYFYSHITITLLICLSYSHRGHSSIGTWTKWFATYGEHLTHYWKLKEQWIDWQRSSGLSICHVKKVRESNRNSLSIGSLMHLDYLNLIWFCESFQGHGSRSCPQSSWSQKLRIMSLPLQSFNKKYFLMATTMLIFNKPMKHDMNKLK